MIKQIIKETNKYIQDTKVQSHSPVEWWRSSSLGSCMRGRLLSRLFAGEVTPQYDDTTLGIFQMGHITEESIMHTLRQSKDWVMFTQGKMYSKKYNIKGHFDALLINTKTNQVLLLENKSRNSNAFKFATKEASIHYKMQAHSYLYMINESGFDIEINCSKLNNTINEIQKLIKNSYGDTKVKLEEALLCATSQYNAIEYADDNRLVTYGEDDKATINLKVKEAEILYVSKDTYEMLEFPVKLDDKDLAEAWQFEMDTLNYCWRTKTSPIATPKVGSQGWQSKYCQFCKAGQCDQLDDKNITKAMYDIYEKRTGLIVK